MSTCEVPECQKHLPNLKALYKHRYDIHPGFCHVCFLSFASKLIRDKHIIEVHNRIPCWICNAAPYDGPGCVEHYMECHTFACCFCDGKWLSEKEWHYHIQVFHSSKGNLNDDIFEEQNTDRASDNPIKKFQCGICTKSFNTEAVLIEHYKLMHQVKCFLCSETFTSNCERDAHFKIVHNFKCFLCKETFVSKDMHDEHFSIIHQLKCEVCQEAYQTDSSLKIHYNITHNFNISEIEKDTNKPRDLCSVCSETFDSEKALIDHYQNLHVD